MSKKLLEKLFREFDKDNSGFIDANQVELLLKSIYDMAGQVVVQQNIDNFIKAFDSSNGGKISMDNFITNFDRVTTIDI